MKFAYCPRCDRDVYSVDDRYQIHTTAVGADCPLSLQMVPVVGDTPAHYERRAAIVASLAAEVQDADPANVWDYLTALPAAELQRLMMVALAGIPVDQTVGEMFGWVCDLPAAKASAA